MTFHSSSALSISIWIRVERGHWGRLGRLTLRCVAFYLLAFLCRVVAPVELACMLACIGAVLRCGCCLGSHLQFAYLTFRKSAVVGRAGALLRRLVLLRL